MRHLILSLALVACSSTASAPSDPVIATGLDVSTQQGPVHGAITDANARAWKGIPYAAPPTGPNRFRAPQPAANWSGTRDATAFGSKCAQGSVGSEDCLFLNVYAPNPAPKAVLPVMVFIHGGAFVSGSGSENLYEGSTLATRENVIVVTLNYRLGPLGFLGHSALAAEDPKSGTGNYGLLDQRAALQWVQQNIHAFGGDASNVTLFGESAGGWSVSAHLASAGSKGLFQKAIVESGSTPAWSHAPTMAEADQQTEALAKAAGCMTGTTVSCLRAAPLTDVLNKLPNPNAMQPGGLFQGVGGFVVWMPVADGAFLSGQPNEAWATPANTVPTIVGTNVGEGKLFHAGFVGDNPVKDQTAYEAALTRTFGADAPKVLAHYPVANYKSFDDALSQIDTDAVFTCPARHMARSLSKGVPTWRYQFVHGCDNGTVGNTLGVTHAAELPYVFGANDPLCGIADSSEPLRTATMNYWGHFAKTGDPNGGANPAWPKYDAATDPYMAMNLPPAAASGLSTELCDFWDSMPPVTLPKTY